MLSFIKIVQAIKKVKSNLPSAIELSETADFVYNFVQKPYANEQLRWHIWPTFPLNFLMKFSQNMPLYFFYTMVQKSQKWSKTHSKGGGGFATKPRIRFEFVWTHAQCMPTFRVNACAVHVWSLYRRHGDECARRLRVRIPLSKPALRCSWFPRKLICRCDVGHLSFFFLSFFFCSSLVDSGNL